MSAESGGEPPDESEQLQQLYGFERILESKQVLIVEGKEELVDDYQARLSDSVAVVTFPVLAQLDWTDDIDWGALSGKDVILWPHPDEAGECTMNEIGHAIADIAKQIRIVGIRKGIPPTEGDLVAWLKDGIEDWIDPFGVDEPKLAPEPEPVPDSPLGPEEVEEHERNPPPPTDDVSSTCNTADAPGVSAQLRWNEKITELGNARRFVRLHGKDLRYSHVHKRWYSWDGKRWDRDSSGRVMEWAKDVPKELFEVWSVMLRDPKSDQEMTMKVLKHAMASEKVKSIRATVSLAESEPGIPVDTDAFDSDPWVLNTPNGIVDLRTGKRSPHKREAMCSQMTGAEFDLSARSDRWESCLETWLPDPEVRAFVRRAVGYSVIGSVTEAVLMILWGSGANGKTVFLETIRSVLGDYASHTPAETIIASRSTAIPNDVARLQGKRFVTASESAENRQLAEEKVKALTGGDRVVARFMRGEWFEFDPTFTVWLLTNHRPIICGTDQGIWRRIQLVPFEVEIPAEERISNLTEILKDSWPAVLSWVIEGCLEYQQRGLDAPEAVLAATATYRSESDVFGEFIEERCIVGTGRFATSGSLYSAYQEWTKASGEDTVTKTAFGKKLTVRGLNKTKQSGHRGWDGIALGGTEE